ncbi:MAG TPA: methyltransferase [Firmicutes bacterium]|jgi:putative Mg2+ transporter-C (MgtC) family protein|nr:methyltransferase [Bacillota bacterium]
MQWEILLRILLASIFGAAIGFERTSKRKEAGIRTHFLVGLGSALIMIVSKYAFYDVLHTHSIVLDPSRIAAQVVSGIGFIGAGMIIFQRQTVRGLTTAAGLWATAGIGLAIGAGMYWIGFSATILVLICLEFIHSSFNVFGAKYLKLNIHVSDKNAVQEILKLIIQNNVTMFDFQEEFQVEPSERVKIILQLQVKLPSKQGISQLIADIQQVSGINSIETD